MTINSSGVLERVVADSFVKKELKLISSTGKGEAKFHLGSLKDQGEYDLFFNNFDAKNKYYFLKENLTEFLLSLKIEYCYQLLNQYKKVSIENWNHNKNLVEQLPNTIPFNLIPFHDVKKNRYYIRSTDENDIFFDLFRSIALPKISVLTIKKINGNEFIFTLSVNENYQTTQTLEPLFVTKYGENRIIYGAPGAGKSSYVSEIVGKNYIRTVFHPETQYSDFIGCLKPHKDSSSGNITYSFRKGPFIQILEKALLNPDTHYFLVIEELNRANTAAVFGEIFQLLDRDDEGKSEYPILIQDDDLYDGLEETLGSEHEFIVKRQLMIPSNLSIIATMNSSDQAVFPLDTAFKRRWIFEYLPIDFTNCAKGEIPLHHAVLPHVEWKTLAQTINTVLVQLKVVEDKLIGPWFIKNSDLVEDQAEQTFIGKICSYLWDDALKYKNKDEIFRSDIHGYGELYQRYSDKKPIFSDKFMQMLQTTKDVDTSDKTETE
ncbi:5-methylcytosine-specific restriction enzyme B(EcoKMcrBC) [Acinetobacter pittii]|uniref:McrB family protein n=1 Tax=Acinetobacter pittii TaxID=48296 RepID=UPI000DE759FC|nr:AAA family ATPase [Acinetobacter pittii]SSP30283.1 5-methylcytosine-specific restriction enzyme B(EcoKMcrBC) [Acinetobacter pittii]